MRRKPEQHQQTASAKAKPKRQSQYKATKPKAKARRDGRPTIRRRAGAVRGPGAAPAARPLATLRAAHTCGEFTCAGSASGARPFAARSVSQHANTPIIDRPKGEAIHIRGSSIHAASMRRLRFTVRTCGNHSAGGWDPACGKSPTFRPVLVMFTSCRHTARVHNQLLASSCLFHPDTISYSIPHASNPRSARGRDIVGDNMASMPSSRPPVPQSRFNSALSRRRRRWHRPWRRT